MTDKTFDHDVHKLKLGQSFAYDGKVAFHSVRYDFKPASIDPTKPGCFEIEADNSVTATLPNVEGSGVPHTVYKGNKRPCKKDCVLIVDRSTGEFVLEKLDSNIQLKTSRVTSASTARSSAAPDGNTQRNGARSVTLKDKRKGSKKSSTTKTTNSSSAKTTKPWKAKVPAVKQPSPEASPSSTVKTMHTMSSSSSSSSSQDTSANESDEMDNSNSAFTEVPPVEKKPEFHMLTEDLHLSESGSDSD